MHRQVEHFGRGVKRLLRAVAVVDIEIDDQDSLQLKTLLGVLRRDGDIVEHAESHRLVRLCMMTGRTRKRERILDFAVQHCLDAYERRSRRQVRHHRRIARRDRVCVQERLVTLGRLRDLLVQPVPMDEHDFFSLRRSRRQRLEFTGKRRVAERSRHGIDSRRRFRMALAGIVFPELLGENDACPHPLTRPRQLPAG